MRGKTGTRPVSLIAVGRVRKAFGIKGEVIVAPMTSVPDRFKALRTVFLGSSGSEAVEDRVEYAIVGEKGTRLKLRGVNDRTTAALAVRKYIFVRKSDRVKLRTGEFFIDDLIGLTVLDDGGSPVGVVKEILKLPAQDVYVVDYDGHEVMIPGAKEFIRDINLRQGTITIHLIEGLLEA
jgi:16S rRNA processing protein RimM